MVADLGFITLILATLVALYSVVAAVMGGTQKRYALVESARRAAVSSRTKRTFPSPIFPARALSLWENCVIISVSLILRSLR